MIAGIEKNAELQSPRSALNVRIMQRTAALLALLVFALPAMMTAALIWFSLGRPLLFRQVRSGLGGRSFTLVKFRTMHDIRDINGQLLPDVERETALTRLIRAVRFDEIPQFLAILAGEMDFVGPRPLQPATMAAFGPLGMVRCRVRPGLTGWAQVNGNTRLSDTEKLALDIWYIDHRSIALDARILLLTAATLVRGERTRANHIAAALAHLRARSDGVAAGDRLARRAAP
ncbi:sugar transferase [Mesorhizobium sp. M00.F.Ca.ET.216.01.1.1]|nr:sugar transferase [Mesorhizobium sp. M00.F.Ca.ET.216.01.1.1]TJW14856.1 MAG: sugar transferase [Mesorhizobium sp.]TJW48914.1 MAG: sugar transferase [Mesorhizobium sp.]